MEDKEIYLLIGPKGSGKSHIGELFQKHFYIPFIRVEDWAKDIEAKSNYLDKGYVKMIFQVIEEGIRNELKDKDTLVFESIGLSRFFDQMLRSLSDDFKVVTVGVEANPEQCLERVRSRDQSIHISMPIETITAINEEVVNRKLKTDFQIDNRHATEAELIDQMEKIVKPTSN